MTEIERLRAWVAKQLIVSIGPPCACADCIRRRTEVGQVATRAASTAPPTARETKRFGKKDAVLTSTQRISANEKSKKGIRVECE